MRTDLYDFPLPEAIQRRILEVQRPRDRRDSGRLMVLHRQDGRIEHRGFPDVIEYLRGRPCWVNRSKVMRSRVWCERSSGPGFWTIFLHRQAERKWYCRPEPSVRLRAADRIRLPDGLEGQVVGMNGGCAVFLMEREPDFDQVGTIPLNWGVVRPRDERATAAYEPIYAAVPGSITIPSGGVPFTQELLDQLDVRPLWLHLGYEAYGQISTEEVDEFELPPEEYNIDVPPAPGEEVVAIGTTVVRAIETWAYTGKTRGLTELTIREPFQFNRVSAMLTNFHLPRETLTVMACAFAGRDNVLNAYRTAVEHEYDFSDYGDSMLIL